MYGVAVATISQSITFILYNVIYLLSSEVHMVVR